MEINGEQVNGTKTYAELGLSEAIMRAIEKKGYVQATPVQAGAIPYFMEWKDVIAKAPTGTGKTFAFGIPMVEHIDPECADVQGLVLAPTRELAGADPGGAAGSVRVQGGGAHRLPLRRGPHRQADQHPEKEAQIVVATPGRLMDHMKRRTVRLDKVQTVVLDEADRMLDMGFVRDVTRILDQLKHRRNLGMFSATISREVMDISWVYQRDPVEITVRPVEESKPDITQYRIDLDGREQKLDTIAALITHGEYERAIAFCNTKNMTDRLAGLLKMRGISCEAIHGDIQQRIREKTLEKFKRGEIKVLVATDVAARGLDIDDVDAVFNYDVPDELENYTHRIGRTGRAKRHGVAYTFIATITEGIRMDDIVRNTKAEVQRLRYDADGCLMLVEDGK